MLSPHDLFRFLGGPTRAAAALEAQAALTPGPSAGDNQPMVAAVAIEARAPTAPRSLAYIRLPIESAEK